MALTVRDLLSKVQRGQVRVPKFQRPLRWSRHQVVELMDSLWRGYPIGSLLFWKRPAEGGTLFVGGAELRVPAVSDAWWLVDGQQRTTALAAALLELEHGSDQRWWVHFNPQACAFVSGKVCRERKGIDVPLSAMGDLRRLGRWLRECHLDDDQQTLVEETQKRILDYAIPVYIIEAQDEKPLRGVFARMNSTGVRMRADEVFQALLGSASEPTSSQVDLNQLQQICLSNGFGAIPRGEVLKALLAMSGHDPTKRLEELPNRDHLRLVSAQEAAETIGLTVQFLRTRCGIPHFRLLPYPIVFVLLCRWFHLFPDTDELLEELLSRWVWREAAQGSHQRAEVSRMRRQLREIAGVDPTKVVRKLLAKTAHQGPANWSLGPFDARNARSRIEMLALLSLGPRDQLGVIPLDELTQGRIAREVFVSLGPEVELAKTAANRVLLVSSPTRLEGELKRWNWDTDRVALESHLIDSLSFSSLKSGDPEGFLHLRAGRLVRLVLEFLLKKTGLDGEPDVYPREAYFR